MDYTIRDIQQLQLQLLKKVVHLCNEHNITYYAAYGTVLGAIRHGGFIPWDPDVDIYIPESQLEQFVYLMNQELDDSLVFDFRTKGRRYRDFPRIGYKEYDTNLLHIDVFRLAGAPDSITEQKKLRKITGTLHHIVNLKQKGLWNYITKKQKISKAVITSMFTFFIPLKRIVLLSDYYCKKYPYELANFVGNSASGLTNSIVPKDFIGRGTMVKFEDLEIRVPEQYDKYLKQMYGNYLEYPSEEYRKEMMRRVFHVVTNPNTGLKTLTW